MPDNSCKCTELISASKIKIEERGKKAVFLNHHRSEYQRIRLDGCLIKGAVAADFIVVEINNGCVVVELKGKDVDHALEQVNAGLEYVKRSGKFPPKLAALVVCSGRPTHPSFTTKLQRLKQHFVKNFKAPIHIVSTNCELEINNVLSFNGPFGKSTKLPA